MTVLVTGAAGFIGSHLCDFLVSDAGSPRIIAIDNLMTGNKLRIDHALSSGDLVFHKLDLAKDNIPTNILNDVETVFHLAANPDVQIGKNDTSVDYENNLVATRNLLEALRISEFRGCLVFASTSTVYGEAATVPTPESYGPLIPISLYGASKLACESIISAYAKLFEFKAKLIRFANVVGGRSGHGVIHDFIAKLRTNSQKLEVLGDGSQAKSYVYITDCIKGLIKCSRIGLDLDVFNLGTRQTTTVMEIAGIVTKEMGLPDVLVESGHGRGKNGSGWPGDVKNMLLDCTKLERLGWRPEFSSRQAVEKAVMESLNPHD